MRKVDVYVPGKPICKNVICKRNDTFIWEITGFNEDGSPFDFSDKTFLLQVKDDEDSELTLINMTNASFYPDADTLGVQESVLNLLIINHPKDKMDLSIEGKPYDLQYTDDITDETFTFYEGSFTVTKDVSRLDE